MTEVESILKKALDGRRINSGEALEIFSYTDMTLLGNVASRIAKNKRKNNTVTYIVDRNINYTNICVTDCSFCAFYRKKEDLDSYVHPFEVLAKKIEETIELGGNQILLQGGHNVELKIDYFENLFQKIKERFDIKLHALSPPEIVHTSKISKISISETLKRLYAAG